MFFEVCLAVALQGGVSVLQGGVSESRGTVGILGFRQSVFGHTVKLIHPGSPVAGVLQKGDKLIAVDDNPTCLDTRGEPGTEVKLTVKRGDKIFDVTVRRIAVQELHSNYLCNYFGVQD